MNRMEVVGKILFALLLANFAASAVFAGVPTPEQAVQKVEDLQKWGLAVALLCFVAGGALRGLARLDIEAQYRAQATVWSSELIKAGIVVTFFVAIAKPLLAAFAKFLGFTNIPWS